MSQSLEQGKRKLTAKDAITAGALGAVCIAIRFVFMLVAHQPCHRRGAGSRHLDVPHHRAGGRTIV